ncbi:hypothetical protein Nmel_003405 [Mimus melanotis]
MLIFVLLPIGRATVPKEPKANTLFLEKSSFTGAIPFEIPHSSSPWKQRESRETAPPGPTIRALKRATLRERGWKWLIFPHWTHPGLEAPWWKWQCFCFSGLCLCKLGLMPSGADILEDGPCSLGKSCLDSVPALERRENSTGQIPVLPCCTFPSCEGTSFSILDLGEAPAAALKLWDAPWDLL